MKTHTPPEIRPRRPQVMSMPGIETMPAVAPARSPLECADSSPLSAGDLSPSHWDTHVSFSESWALNAPSRADKSGRGESGDRSPHSTGFTLQRNTDLNAANWATVPQTVSDNGTDKFIIVSPPTGNRFYRLFKR